MADIKLVNDSWNYSGVTDWLTPTFELFENAAAPSGYDEQKLCIKYPSGVMIEGVILRYVGTINVAWGSIYSTQNYLLFPNWKEPFIHRPIIVTGVTGGSFNHNVWMSGLRSTDLTCAGNFFPLSVTSLASSTHVFYAVGIGRWKAEIS